MHTMHIALIYDRPETEKLGDGISRIGSHHTHVTRAIEIALNQLGHTVTACPADHALQERLQAIKPDMAFNLSICIHGQKQCSYAPALLERMRLPFSGSNATVCADAYDKARARQIMRKQGVRVPEAILVQNADAIRIPRSLAFPLFVKPVRGGCSKGIRQENLIRRKAVYSQRVRRIFQRIHEPLLVEEYIAGREFSVGVIGNDNPRFLPIAEFIHTGDAPEMSFRDYTRKMIDYTDEKVACPPRLTTGMQQTIQTIAIQAYRSLRCRDYARVDIRLDAEEQPYVLEVNALPNLLPGESTFATMARADNISFRALIGRVVQCACGRYGIHV